MPTPFYHLKIVKQLLSSDLLEENIKEKINSQLPSFLFGNTAPDLQSLSGQSRADTHFFTLPLSDDWDAEKEMIKQYPNIGDRGNISEEANVFMAGYFCHLLADQAWIRKIYWPYFSNDSRGLSIAPRRLLHDRLRTWMDQVAINDIPSDYGRIFNQANTNQNLPFATNADLANWHSYLADQLLPNGKILTAEVFSKRHGMEENEFIHPLIAEEWAKNRVFTYIPEELLVEYFDGVIANSVKLLDRLFSDY